MPESFQKRGHSTQIEMELFADGKTLSIAQLGPNFLILTQPAELNPGPAEISLVIDGEEERWKVWLPNGASPSCPTTPLTNP